MFGEITRNRLNVVVNSAQGNYKKVLVLCSAGILRSATTQFILTREPYNYNVRNAGMDKNYALIYGGEAALLIWPDEVICMECEQYDVIVKYFQDEGIDTPVFNLNVPDSYDYRDPYLMKIIQERYDRIVLKKGPMSKMV